MQTNARVLACVLADQQIKVISGGTDTHIVLLDLSPTGINGQQAQDALAKANITSNKNPIPFDSAKPAEWVGLRLGVAAATTRGLAEPEFEILGGLIADLIKAEAGTTAHSATSKAGAVVADLCNQFPIYR